MAHSKPLPAVEQQQPTPLWHWLVLLGAIALAPLTGMSLHRRGSSGWRGAPNSP